MSRLIVISNRLPCIDEDTACGGLAVGLKAALEESGGLWFGWSGKTASEPSSVPVTKALNNFTLATIDLTEDEIKGYYEAFANAVLWPLFHGRLDLTHFDDEDYRVYCEVNRRFARAIAPILRTDDIIWVHDYHLIPLGRELRNLGITNPLGFFLHTPFPSAEDFRALPCHSELIDGLAAYDLVGFQTAQYCENFCASVDAPQKLKSGVFPIGIDTRAFSALAASSEVECLTSSTMSRLGSQNWILGVERLDYTKGLAERFRAFETLLTENRDLRGTISLLQIAAPSREKVIEYQTLREELETLSGHINAQFATIDWTPLKFVNRSVDQAQLTALYRSCKIGLVTPLRDGMNLVAKEYVAAQDPEDPGVLVLSRFAGAAEELEGALLVNPYDINDIVQALLTALNMPLPERKSRWKSMMQVLLESDVHRWRNKFLDALLTTHYALQSRDVA